MTVAGRTSAVPRDEYTITFVRSPGPGGQNVNKVATACELRFRVGATSLLDDDGKRRLRSLAGRRLTRDDEIILAAHRHRSQEANRRDALARLEDLIRRAAQPPRMRKATRPGMAARERRLESKKRRKSLKRLRARPPVD